MCNPAKIYAVMWILATGSSSLGAHLVALGSEQPPAPGPVCEAVPTEPALWRFRRRRIGHRKVTAGEVELDAS